MDPQTGTIESGRRQDHRRIAFSTVQYLAHNDKRQTINTRSLEKSQYRTQKAVWRRLNVANAKVGTRLSRATLTTDKASVPKCCRQAPWRQAERMRRKRMGRDSNPWWTHAHSGFQDRRLRPLGHPSGTVFYRVFCMPFRFTTKHRLRKMRIVDSSESEKEIARHSESPKKRIKPLSEKGLRVRLLGLEPRAYGLKVRCSTD